MDGFVFGTAVTESGKLTVKPDDCPFPPKSGVILPKGCALAAGERVLMLYKGGRYAVVAVY